MVVMIGVPLAMLAMCEFKDGAVGAVVEAVAVGGAEGFPAGVDDEVGGVLVGGIEGEEGGDSVVLDFVEGAEVVGAAVIGDAEEIAGGVFDDEPGNWEPPAPACRKPR